MRARRRAVLGPPSLALGLLLLAPFAGLAWAQSSVGDVVPVHVTFYQSTGSPTYSGEWPYDGSAGCSADIPLGSQIEFPDGRVVTCNDRGADGYMAPHWDIYCPYSYAVCEQSIPGVDNWTVPVPVTVIRWGW